MMSRQIPPLTALRAFEAAARLGGVSKAADELHVTHAAVSHQIRALEEWFGVSLFDRAGRRIRLTEAGAKLLGPVSAAFDGIASAVELVCEDMNQKVLTVSAAPSVAYKLLVPRLGSFAALEPDVEVHLHHSVTLANFVSDGIDVAVRFGRGDWPGTISKRIMDGFAQPFASPALLKSAGHTLDDLPLTPEQIAELPLHHEDSTEFWRTWFEKAGAPGLRFRRGAVFHDAASILNVAVAGQGVVLARPALAESELGSGMLAALSDIKIEEDAGYYLVYPRSKMSDPLIQSFEAWVFAELAQPSGGASYSDKALAP
ncbi:transcriptional regulator GcvA [uncultured Nisaea sp.]|uniref:transcriptional regulator GcvA n=1 Tax=uncultured Nisaea sp. TaxID=538215 RepID=UPI0030EC4EAC|tara:strand:+ start:1844 stop:2788 length:945 start_codon:yes stop_codon:yes gene_type:complete